SRENRIELAQEVQILGRGEVLPDRLEVPQCCIRSVVLGLLTGVRKYVGQHALIDEAGECPQNPSGDFCPTGRDSQAWQGDHGVPPPIAEPVIAGDQRFAVWVVFQGPLDDELVCGEDELPNPGCAFVPNARISLGPDTKKCFRICNLSLSRALAV